MWAGNSIFPVMLPYTDRWASHHLRVQCNLSGARLELVPSYERATPLGGFQRIRLSVPP